MRNFYPYLKPYKRSFIIIPLFVLIDVVCEISQPRLMSAVVDGGILNKDLHYVLKTGLAMIGLALVAILANLGNIYYSSAASVGFVTSLRRGLFYKIQTFSFADTDYFSSASLTTRITNDANVLQQVLMMSLRMLLRAPLMLIFAVVFAIMINKELALVLAFSIPVLAISIYLLLRKGLPYFIKMQKRVDRLNATVQENLLNVRVVKAFVRQDFEKEKFEKVNTDLMTIAEKASGIVIMIMPVMQLIMGISLVAVTWFGGQKVMAGSLPLGGLMSFLSYIAQILIALMILSMTFMMLSRAIASGDRIEEVLLKASSLTNTPGAAEKGLKVKHGSIRFDHVSFRYSAGSEKANLEHISFDIEAGSTVAIIGGTGSGKSTLVQLIPRLYDVSSGAVCIDGVNVKDYTLAELRSSIGIVLQQNQLFSGTIYDNLKWGDPNASEAEITEAARIASADDFIRSFPDGYQTMLGQGGVNLSGGQKQRICIARTLLKKPAILILDDSTSALDITTDRNIREGLDKYLSNTTVLIIAQRISSVQHADKIIVLDEGRVAGMGQHASLLNDNAIYQEIYQSQYLNKEETV
ncbi:MAG: ABC transporter ATP-binding protein [Sphingobacteriales bacterium]|nr:ABC transporter ATP-binding protein [Sphingobacteriales bacterium]OJY90488.1 MAG: multidrug ABC transporter ATP-binding protein [Sphingobacteriales bacterium 44-15]